MSSSTTQVPSGRRSLSALLRPKVVQTDHQTFQFPDIVDDTVPGVPGIDHVHTQSQTFNRRRFYSHGQQDAPAWQASRRKSMVRLNTMSDGSYSTNGSRESERRANSSRFSDLFKHKPRENLVPSESSRTSALKAPVSSNWLQRAANTTFRGRRRSNFTENVGSVFQQEPVDIPERQLSCSQVAVIPLRLRGGDAARAAAAAAASSEKVDVIALPSPKLARLRDGKLSPDNESGIGIDVPERIHLHESTNGMSRRDPASLPEEIFHHILTFLEAPSLMCAELVSQRWYSTAGSHAIWRDVFAAETYRASAVQTTIQMGGAGSGTMLPVQKWKQMWKVRQALNARWSAGRAAAIYLEGHSDSVYCVQFDEEKIITGSRDRTIRVWDLRTFACVRVLGIPKDTNAMSTSTPVGSRMSRQKPIATLTPPPALCVSPAAQKASLNHSGSILCLKFDTRTMVTGSSDTSLLVWDLTQDYLPVQRLSRHRSGVLDVCFDEKHIVSCSKDTTICVWDRATGTLVSRLTGHLGPVNAVQLRGSHVVSASGDGVAKLWHLTSGLCVKEFPSRDRGLACVEFSPDGRTILAGGNDQVIYQFDANTGELVRELGGHANLVRSLHLDAINGRVISGSYDYSVKAFDLADGTLLCDFVGWTTSWMLSAVADYRRIVATSQDGRVVVMDFGLGLKGIELLDSREEVAQGEGNGEGWFEPTLVPAKGGLNHL